MPLAEIFRKTANKTYLKYAEEPAKALLHLGAVGWILSSVAQVFMLVKNKDIDSKKKKFLIPQEIADGAINVGLYYTITALIKHNVENLVEKGHFVTKKTNDFLMGFKNVPNTLTAYIKGVSQHYDNYNITDKKNLKKPISGFLQGTEEILKKIDYNNLGEKGYQGILEDSFIHFDTLKKRDDVINGMKEVAKDFGSFKNGVMVVGTIAGSVLASSIITPIVRNKVANHFQDKTVKKEKKHVSIQSNQPYLYNNASPSVFKKFVNLTQI